MFATALLFCVLATSADPVRVELKKDGDKVTQARTDERVTIVIDSKTGIGGASLRPGKDGWPKALRLDLGLKALEGFTITGQDRRVHSFLGSEKPEVFDLRERENKWAPIDSDVDLAPTITRVGDRIHVDIPAALLDKKNKQLAIEWVDFYRG
jgi:hypothetical protein